MQYIEILPMFHYIFVTVIIMPGHYNDQDMPNFDDDPTDDVLKITGFSVDEDENRGQR